LVIIDLSTPGIDPADLVPRVRATVAGAVRIVAFGPHVHELKLAAARAAGCDDVVTRGQFHANLDRILASVQHAPPASSEPPG
jgi:CheY-like chemotaxis protein